MRRFFRKINGRRKVIDVEWRDASAKALLRREPSSLPDPKHVSPHAAVLIQKNSGSVGVFAYMPKYGTYAPPANWDSRSGAGADAWFVVSA
jgi:hypothetical protein